MAKLLHDLLGDTTHSLNYSIGKLERYSGNNGRDVRLSAEIIGKTHLALKSLGLDPRDSHGKEVYAALSSLLKMHDTFLRRHIGVGKSSSPEKTISETVSFVEKLSMPRMVWVMKPKVVKDFLLQKPPKRTMKALGYRSVHSMIKREPIPQVLYASRHLEGKTWLTQLNSHYTTLTANDFEQREMAVLTPTSRHWREQSSRFATSMQSSVACLPEMGAIIVLPHAPKQSDVLAITILLVLLESYAELRMYSSCFKLHQLSGSFGDKIVHIVKNNLHLLDEHTSALHDWRLIHAFYSDKKNQDHPEQFYPHVTLEDLAWRQNEDVLLSIEPAFSFWRDISYVGAMYSDSDKPISFNVLDVTLNTMNRVPFADRSVSCMRSSLWDEILLRYMDSNHVRSHVLRALSGVSSRQEEDFILL